MKKLKQNSLAVLASGLEKFEDSRNAVKHSDYTDLQTFMHDFLNTPDKKREYVKSIIKDKREPLYGSPAMFPPLGDFYVQEIDVSE